jgi:predicted esterase
MVGMTMRQHRYARQSVQLLRAAGADVETCEDEVGHRVSATCLRKLNSFFGD